MLMRTTAVGATRAVVEIAVVAVAAAVVDVVVAAINELTSFQEL